jgi:mono/diheme cytochrome c family protein
MQKAPALFVTFALTFFSILCVVPISVGAKAHDAAANYKEKCAVCHGTDGAGKTEAQKKMHVPDLRSKQIRSMSDADLYETIAKGTKHKEYQHAYLYTGLTEAEIRDIVKYIRAMN